MPDCSGMTSSHFHLDDSTICLSTTILGLLLVITSKLGIKKFCSRTGKSGRQRVKGKTGYIIYLASKFMRLCYPVLLSSSPVFCR